MCKSRIIRSLLEMGASNPILFVYGTLMRSGRSPQHQRLAEEAEFLGPAVCQGRLYQVDWYPALIPSATPDDRVYGEVYRMALPHHTLDWIDAYEGISASEGADDEYRREIIAVEMEDRSVLEAWAYLYIRSIDDLDPIPDGRFISRAGRSRGIHG